MLYHLRYLSPIGPLLLTSDGESLIRLTFETKEWTPITEKGGGHVGEEGDWQEIEGNILAEEAGRQAEEADRQAKEAGGQAKETGIQIGEEGIPTEHPVCLSSNHGTAQGLDIFVQTRRWLDLYFAGQVPHFTPRLNVQATAFRQIVCDIMRTIPYGHTTTYRAIAQAVMQRTGCPRMAAQAVGGAVGHNPIALIIPCHRVVGTDGSLTGYGGGLARKTFLLHLEQQVLHDRQTN